MNWEWLEEVTAGSLWRVFLLLVGAFTLASVAAPILYLSVVGALHFLL